MGGPNDDHPLALERIVFFSDAVMAIAITLLAIDLQLPAASGLSDQGFIDLLLGLLPRYIAFAITFAVIGIYWFAHHRMYRFIVAWDGRLVALNLLFLFFVVQLPFASSILGEQRDLASATAIYAFGLVLLGCSSVALWAHAVRGRLVSDAVTPAVARYIAARSATVAVVFGLSVPIAFISPFIAQVSWLLVAVAQRLVTRRWAPRTPRGA